MWYRYSVLLFLLQACFTLSMEEELGYPKKQKGGLGQEMLLGKKFKKKTYAGFPDDVQSMFEKYDVEEQVKEEIARAYEKKQNVYNDLISKQHEMRLKKHQRKELQEEFIYNAFRSNIQLSTEKEVAAVREKILSGLWDKAEQKNKRLKYLLLASLFGGSIVAAIAILEATAFIAFVFAHD